MTRLQEQAPPRTPPGWRAAGAPSSEEVRLVDPFGKQERKVAAVSVKAAFQARHLAWSPDSKELVIVDQSPPAASGSLFLISIDTGERRQLTEPSPGTYLDASPAFSPDGTALTFIRFASGVGRLGDLFLLDPSRERSSEADVRRLTATSSTRDVAGWTRDGAHVIYSSNAPRGRRLLRVRASGAGEPEPVATLRRSGLFPAPALSRDGQRLVHTNRFFDTAITRLQLADGSEQPVMTKLIDSTRMDLYGEYSPDGNRIAFSSNRSGDGEIWISKRDGSNPVQLTSVSAGFCHNPRWSPDGDRILFAAVREGLRDIWTVSSEGGAARSVTSGRSVDIQANWSRDGEWGLFHVEPRGAVRCVEGTP